MFCFGGQYTTWLKRSFNFVVGHGDSNSRNTPTLVKDICNVGQVACGSSHTIALSQDGWTIWSFGGGDNGKTFCFLPGQYACLILELFHNLHLHNYDFSSL